MSSAQTRYKTRSSQKIDNQPIGVKTGPTRMDTATETSIQSSHEQQGGSRNPSSIGEPTINITINSIRKPSIVHKPKPFRCARCDKAFFYKYALMRHDRNTHGHNTNENRTKPLKSSSKSKNSNFKNPKVFVYTCDVCEVTFCNPFLLIDHRKTTHRGIKPYSCKLCNQNILLRHKWNRHLKNHYVWNMYSLRNNCTRMPKSHKSGINFQFFDMHTSYECSGCKQFFSVLMDCKNHILQKHKVAKATGSVPGSRINDNKRNTKVNRRSLRLSSKSSIRKHDMSSNLTKIRYRCNICEKSYSKMCVLFCHQVVLHNKKPSIMYCAVCNKGFECKRDLVEHLKTHPVQVASEPQSISTLKPESIRKCHIPQFMCRICQLEFKNNRALRMHVEAHVRTLFACTHCDVLFKKKRALDKHISTDHGVGSAPNQET